MRSSPAVALLIALAWGCGPKGTAERADESVPARSWVGRRTIEPRLSGAAWAPCVAAPDRSLVPAPRCPPPADDIGPAPARVVDRGAGQPAAAAARFRHRRSVVRLATADRARAVDAAVADLERAVASLPGDAALGSDLAAGYLLRAQWHDDPLDLLRALDRALQAVELDPSAPAARFNLGLLADKLSMPGRTRQAWRRYLALDDVSGWRREAERALTRSALGGRRRRQPDRGDLVRSALRGEHEAIGRAVRRDRRDLRVWAEDTVLAAWARGLAAGDWRAAAAALATARAIGSALAAAGGDHLLADTVAALAGAMADGERAAWSVAGHLDYGRGMAAIEGGDYAAAAAPLARAEELLTRAASPFARRAAVQRLRCAYQAGEHAAVVSAARALSARIDGRYPAAAAGRAARVAGSSLVLLGRPAAAVAWFEEAVAGARRSGEPRAEIAALGRLAAALDALGALDRAWEARYRSLRLLARWPDATQLRLTLTDAAYTASDLGLHHAAGELLAEVAALAGADGRPLAAASAHLHRAAALDRRGDAEGARRELARAQTLAAGIVDPGQRATIVGNVLVGQGRVLLAADPEAARQALERALGIYRRRSFDLLVPEALRLRARAERARGDLDAARRDLEAAVAARRVQRAAIAPVRDRIAFGEGAAALFDDLLDLLQAAGAPPATLLEQAEAGRSQLLREQLRDAEAGVDAGAALLTDHAFDATRFAAALPPSAAALVFEVLDDRVLAWALAAGRDLRQVVLPLARPALERLIEAGSRAIATAGAAGHDDHELASLRALHELLLAPFTAELEGVEKLIVVPDEALFNVPFGALYDAAAGRFAVADRAIVVAPSLAVYQLLQQRAARRGAGGLRRAVVVANPDFASALFPRLPPLPMAAREGRSVAERFAGARLWSGAEATAARLLAGLGDADLFHIAGHAVTDHRRPLRSALLLAPEGEDDDGMLTAEALIGVPMPHLRLAVLSACRSAASRPAREALLGLLWPFFAAGVPQVVASTADVDDGATAVFFAAFYRHLAAVGDPAEALGRAQREQLAGGEVVAGRRPLAWAAFQVFGAWPAGAGARPAERADQR